MIIRISVVIPTLGRPTLQRTLNSIVEAGVCSQDEVLVVWGDAADPTEVVERVTLPCPRHIIHARAPKPDYGNTQKTAGMRAARGSHVAFMDDDDIYLPGALDRMRKELEKNPGLPHQFQVQLGKPHSRLIWHKPKVELGNVTTDGIVVPNRPDLPSWPVRRSDGMLTPWQDTGNDALFAMEAERLFNGFVFSPALVAHWRP